MEILQLIVVLTWKVKQRISLTMQCFWCMPWCKWNEWNTCKCIGVFHC
jgi:hypothetical protein